MSARAKTPTNPLAQYPGYVLRRASAALMAGFAVRVKDMGIRPAEGAVLLVIQANPNITPGRVGKMLGIASANMTPLVARLVHSGYIGRQAVDGRSHGLTLSASGRVAARRLNRAVAAHEKNLLARIPVLHRKSFLAALRALHDGDD